VSSTTTCRGDAVGVDRVGLAALAGGEHPGPGRQFRRDVQDGLAVGDQALSDVPADAAAALDRPDPVGVFAASGEHHLVAVGVGAEPALAEHAFALVDDLDGGGALVRVYTDDDLAHAINLSLDPMMGSTGGQRYFELGIPLLSHSAPR
jgi:hypothetical protein